MEILRAEIERKRKLLEEKNVIVSKRKLISRHCIVHFSIFVCPILAQNEKKKYFKASELCSQTPDSSFSSESTVEEKDICDESVSSKCQTNSRSNK